MKWPLLVALLLYLSAAPAALCPQEATQTCPWCRDDPARMAAFGVLSHGPFPFAKGTSEDISSSLPSGTAWMFVETRHLRLASNLPAERLRARDLEELESLLAPLREELPDIPRKLRELDPWLRLHLMAIRAEAFYARFQRLLQVTDDDFPLERTLGEPYMGAGKFLGEKDKFELLFHQRRATHQLFTRQALGMTVTDALRWHFSPQHKMFASIPAEDADLAGDRYLVPHTVHLLSHLFLCAYKDFSYDPPIWLDEGLAHAMEREVRAESTTLDGDEGSGPHRGGHQDWKNADRALVRRGRTTPLALLVRKGSFGELSLDEHKQVWSLVTFLYREHPDAFARFLGGVKGQLDANQLPSGEDLPGLQRTLFREHFGWTLAQVDEAWARWVTARDYDIP
jgi:hypothetical protein